MPNPRVLRTVAAELRRQGFPPADVARLLQELEDHVMDLFMEQGGRMDKSVQVDERIESRLGQAEVLVAAALANRRQASVFGRHPIVSFVLAPIPVVVLSWLGCLFLCFGLLKMIGWLLGDTYVFEGRAVRDYPAVLIYAMNAMVSVMRFLPPAVATALLCWCANRAGMSWRWTATVSGLIGSMSGALIVQLTLPVEPGTGQLVLSLGFPVHQWINLIQFLVPVAVGLAFLWGSRERVVAKA